MTFRKTLILCIILGCIVPSLKAGYYQSDLFPIGLTGINPSGSNCPYSSADVQPPWAWTPDSSVNNEQDLIFALGVNVIGCQDAQARYIGYTDPNRTVFNDYIHKVCKPSHEDEDIDDIYVITVSYYVSNEDTLGAKGYSCSTSDCSVICYDSLGYTQWREQSADGMFRSPTRGSGKGFGDIQFSHSNWESGSSYNCHGAHYDNWDVFDGETTWRQQADIAVSNFKGFLERFDNPAPYIWGYNLISEDPAIWRHTSGNPPWHGCFAGVDYLFTGHGYGKSNYNYFRGKSGMHDQEMGGIRGVEDSCLSERRMFVAKGVFFYAHRAGYDIFEALPDIDVFVDYWHSWCRAKYNYGEQGVFDNLLYWPEADKGGYHNDAVYFQRYGHNHLAYPDQKRRWVPWIALEWRGTGPNGEKASVRRPCPPEIRCASYLVMSRGAKGILFHGWSHGINTNLWPGENVKIPCTEGGSLGNVGIRDHYGFPFGDWGGDNPATEDQHMLNNGVGAGAQSTVWHNRHDSTYYYLCELIPELKKITPKLMELDWVNAYSLMSTDPNWTNPCPHYYMEDVWGVDYMDVAFFDHPYEPVGVEYFMMVNREGIPDMTNRTVSVALDAQHWPEEDTLILTDIANADNPRTIRREGDRFVFTEVFEPGEGKLYRVAPTNEAPITLVPSTEGGVR